jgi:methionyl aminopeptidase
MIVYKSAREVAQMRETGQTAAAILRKMAAEVRPGATTFALNEICREELARVGGIGLSKNYPTYKVGQGYPAESCISVNEEVVHGIPGPRKLRNGDIVTLDLAMKLGGYCADTAITVGVGTVPPDRQRLVDTTRDTLAFAIESMRPGVRWSDIAREMQRRVEKQSYGVVQEFVGHGIGRTMHEDPKVPNFTNAEQRKGDFVLRPGMTFAVEPMVVIGTRKVKTLSDKWTVITQNRKAACHFEHTVAITDDGCEVLTLPEGENLRGPVQVAALAA